MYQATETLPTNISNVVCCPPDEGLKIQALQETALKLWEVDKASALELGRALIAVRDAMAKRGAFTKWFQEAGLEENRVYYCIRKAEGKVNPPRTPGTLSRDFVVPPFSILDAAQGYWVERKRYWEERGAVGTHSGQDGTTYGPTQGFADFSAFDPVLAECMYLWFCPPSGRILDPFAGSHVKGFVASKMGLEYVGVECREEQVRANEEQASKFGVLPKPTWLCGDSGNMSAHVPDGEAFDMVCACPPYYDLERYSDCEADISAKKTYAAFMDSYRQIFAQAVSRLKWNRFLVVTVGEIRDKKTGFYRNFVGDTISCLTGLGLNYYNEIILHTADGTAAMRARKYIETSRKLAKTHQNVLCFFKGDDPTVLGKIVRPDEQNSAPEGGADRMKFMKVILIFHLVRDARRKTLLVAREVC